MILKHSHLHTSSGIDQRKKGLLKKMFEAIFRDYVVAGETGIKAD